MIDSKDKPNAGNRWPHRIGCLLAAIVFPLIWVGNLVTTADAGMAVPDWPNTYGYNLFLYPYREWFYGPWDLFVEHGHRLLASIAGLVAIVLVITSYRSTANRTIRWLSIAILALVIAQGVLGGIRVIYDARWVAKVHGCVGPFFFACVVAYCVITSRWWQNAISAASPFGPSGKTERNKNGFLLSVIPRLATLLLITSYIQLALGAFLRHIDDVASPKQYALLVACHIITALLLVAGTMTQFLVTRRRDLTGVGVKASINFLTLLVLLQLGLGISTWVVKFGWPAWFANFEWAASYIIAEKSFLQINIVTAHAAIGSLILAFWTIHALRANRVLNQRLQQNHELAV